jgi:hypothetical protein
LAGLPVVLAGPTWILSSSTARYSEVGMLATLAGLHAMIAYLNTRARPAHDPAPNLLGIPVERSARADKRAER